MTYRLAAKFYDLFGQKNDLDFYKELALQSRGTALELGVGTARVAIPLARAGIRVVGIDNSDHMLRVAKQKLAKEPPLVRNHVVLKKGDMRNFELKKSFSFIYIPASTFDHCITVEDQLRCLNCFHKHLEDGGRFAFDLEQVAAEKPKASWGIDRKELGKGKMVVRSWFTKRDKNKCISSLNLFYDVYKNGKLMERYHEYGEVAMISKEEIIDMLEERAFKIEAIYGDFEKSKYQKESQKIVLVTSKR